MTQMALKKNGFPLKNGKIPCPCSALVAACYHAFSTQRTLNTRTFHTANKACVLIGQLD